MLSIFSLTDDENKNTRDAFFEIFENKQDDAACKDCIRGLVTDFTADKHVYVSLLFYKKPPQSTNGEHTMAMDFFFSHTFRNAINEPFFGKHGIRRVIKMHENQKIEWIEDKEN
jgi:hypothetical protein